MPDYEEHEYDYLWFARHRDRVMGIPIESEDSITDRYFELYPQMCSDPPVCTKYGWCSKFMQNQPCACDKSFLHEDPSDSSDEDDDQWLKLRENKDQRVHIEVYKAANLAMGLGPCRPSPGTEGSAEQLAEIARS